MNFLGYFFIRVFRKLKFYAWRYSVKYYFYYIRARKSDLGVFPESLQGDNRSYNKFVIIAHARSGSTLLTQLLRNHPNAVAYSELFLNNSVGSRADFFNENTLRWMAFRNKYPIEFIERQVFGGYAEHIDAVGFKLFPEQLDKKKFRKVWQWLDDHPEVKIICLERENFLETYVSAQIAYRTNRYSVGDKAPAGKQLKVRLNLTECLREFDMRKSYNVQGRKHADGHESLMLTYEALKNDIAGTSENMQKLIGLKVTDLKVVLRKQEGRPLSEIIENFSEIEHRLRETEWASFLKEN